MLGKIGGQVSAVKETVVPLAIHEPISKKSNSSFYSSLVRSIAKEEGITQTELDGIPVRARTVASLKRCFTYLEGIRANAASSKVKVTPLAPHPRLLLHHKQ